MSQQVPWRYRVRVSSKDWRAYSQNSLVSRRTLVWRRRSACLRCQLFSSTSPWTSALSSSRIASAIKRGVYRPGARFPSLRQSSRAHRIALGTTLRVYGELEGRGLIEARVRSGYFVRAPRSAALKEPSRTKPSRQISSVDVSELVFRLLDEIKGSKLVPLGSAFPSPELFPLATLGRVAASVARRLDPRSSVRDLPPGNIALRRAIAQRYWLSGCDVDAEGILITNGALEAINLCLQ